MSNKTQETLDLYNSVVMPTYAPSTVLSSGKGVTVRDIDGLALYDFTSGIGVHNVGHSHSKVVKAVQDQAAKLIHASNLFANSPATELAAKLVELSGLGGKVFFCNSGAEANEAAIRTAAALKSSRCAKASTAALSRPSPLRPSRGVRRVTILFPLVSHTPTSTILKA